VQPGCDVQSATESWLQGVGVPMTVWGAQVHPLTCEQEPTSSWLHGLGVPVHSDNKASHWQPGCALQARSPPTVREAQLRAVPKQAFTMVQPGMIGMPYSPLMVSEQSTITGVPVQMFSGRHRAEVHPNPIAQCSSDVHGVPSRPQ
jgi:hypothetical protein